MNDDGKSDGQLDRHPASARFHQLLREIADLHDRKQQDYGSDTDPFANVRASERWGMPGWVGALMRLNDKVARLQNFARKGKLANESAEDSMRDIAIYALIALILYEEASEATKATEELQDIVGRLKTQNLQHEGELPVMVPITPIHVGSPGSHIEWQAHSEEGCGHWHDALGDAHYREP